MKNIFSKSVWLAAVALAVGTLFPSFSVSATPLPSEGKKVYVCPDAADGAKEYDQPGFCGMSERILKVKQLRVAVLLFKGAQVIDYAGPMEVFAQTGAKVFTVAPTTELRTSAMGILQFKPDYDFSNAPAADVLLVPGGDAAELELIPAYYDWLRKRAGDSQMVLSVCTGAFILGQAGLLDGLPAATTIAGQIDNLSKYYPKLKSVVKNRRVVDTGKFITTGGLSAGIDGALHVVERWMGRADATGLARGLEYDWNPDNHSAYGELVSNRMPEMWHAMVPDDTPFERYSDKGDAKQWETRAHVGAVSNPTAFLDYSKEYLKSEAWTPAGTSRLSRSYRRHADGKDWLMTVALVKTKDAENHDLSVRVARAGGKPR
jgi:putative intracellular protease/amidase